jgi:hypothetical protein
MALQDLIKKRKKEILVEVKEAKERLSVLISIKSKKVH